MEPSLTLLETVTSSHLRLERVRFFSYCNLLSHTVDDEFMLLLTWKIIFERDQPNLANMHAWTRVFAFLCESGVFSYCILCEVGVVVCNESWHQAHLAPRVYAWMMWNSSSSCAIESIINRATINLEPKIRTAEQNLILLLKKKTIVSVCTTNARS